MKRGLLPVALLLAACTADRPEPGTDGPTIFAAASLRDAFDGLAEAYADETGVTLTVSYDASSALRAQIEEGAPADLLISADVANTQALVDAGLTDGDARTFGANGLAIVVPADGSPVSTWQDLAADGVRIVAAGEDVPITGYAEELVATLAARDDAPSGFAEAYESNVVSREDNVRAALTKVELGEGDAAIVYETDVASSDDVSTVTLPEGASPVAEYAFVVLADADADTHPFAEWLLGSEAQAILAEFGFRPAGG